MFFRKLNEQDKLLNSLRKEHRMLTKENRRLKKNKEKQDKLLNSLRKEAEKRHIAQTKKNIKELKKQIKILEQKKQKGLVNPKIVPKIQVPQ